jgi:diamine N-acetyltransferase
MDNILIRKITIDDIEELQKIGQTTFNETFAPWNSEANMKKYLEEVFSLEQLTLELENKNSEFYFAIFENSPIGYLKINWGEAQTEIKDADLLEIERIYVLKQFFGKKVGQLLYETAHTIAKTRKYRFLWLGVWENNHRAIGFYKKNGFTEFDKHIFKLGDDIQTDIIMKLELDQK